MSLFDRLAEAASLPPPSNLLAGDFPEQPGSHGIAAAVLIAVTDRETPGVILTVRREDLRKHGGQIAFPGGRVDPGEDATAAALREAWEETALDPGQVRLAGMLDPYRTITGYRIAPVLALIPADLPRSPHEHEVADIFEAPLAHILANQHHVRRRVLFEGQERHYYEITWGQRRIWGATAAMIVNLSKRLQWN